MKQTGDAMMATLMTDTIAEYMGEIRWYCIYTIYQSLFQIFLDKFVCAYLKIGFENILYGDGKRLIQKLKVTNRLAQEHKRMRNYYSKGWRIYLQIKTGGIYSRHYQQLTF